MKDIMLIDRVGRRALKIIDKYPEERWGQAHFNALEDIDPKLANEIRGGPMDPFYNDGHMNAFWSRLVGIK